MLVTGRNNLLAAVREQVQRLRRGIGSCSRLRNRNVLQLMAAARRTEPFAGRIPRLPRLSVLLFE